MKYEISKDREEILKTINDSNNQNRNILWQNHKDHRLVLEITDIQIDPIQEVIKFSVSDPSSIDPELTTYIKLNHRNMIFKGSVIAKLNGFILVRIPDEIKLEELREHKRYVFAATEERKIILQFDSQLSATAKEHMAINLLDVSQSGLGVFVSYFDMDKLLKAQHLSLSTLGHFNFKSHFYMDPVYRSQVNVNLNGNIEEFFKIGYKFQEVLPDNLVENFIREQEGMFASELGFLGRSRKFQKKLHQEYRSMVKKLETKKEFYEFFTGHGSIQHLGQEYLPKHIRLLAMFSCALARLLGFNHKTVTQQLTYMAFVHDIAFFNNPKLAQIRDEQHFEKVKYLLKMQERELFYRSSVFAYKFSLSDPHAPVGAEHLLQQYMNYKTSANKEIFLANGDVSSLVAMFLVAHDLVDYVMTHPNWTFYDYLQRYPFAIYGGVFTDIFDLINSERLTSSKLAA